MSRPSPAPRRRALPLPPDVRRRWMRAAAKVNRILRASEEPMSLDSPVGSEDSSQLGDFIEDRGCPGADGCGCA